MNRIINGSRLMLMGLTLLLGCSSGNGKTGISEQVGEQVEAIGQQSSASHGDSQHAPPPSQQRHNHKGQFGDGECEVSVDENAATFSFKARSGGLELEQTLHRTSEPWGLVNDIKISLGNREIWHWVSSGKQDGSFVMSVDYAKPLAGVKHVEVTSDGNTATALVDGRQTLPFSVREQQPIVFPNGQGVPDVRVPPGLGKQATKLLEIAKKEAPNCWSEGAASLGVAPEAASAVATLAATPDFGHRSSTHASVGCVTCFVSCDVASGVCLYAAATAGAACGPFAWICIPVGLGGCLIGAGICAKECNNGLCCPHECGGSNFNPTCCEQEETCLSTQTGLCCSSGKSTCGQGPGAQCCASDETCIANGPSGGKCCGPNQEACGSVCCDDLETCVDRSQGLCCFQPCGTSCCNFGQVCESEVCVDTPPPECVPCTARIDCFERFGEHGRCDVDGCCREVPF